jgi:hypothetical protein
LLSSFIVTVADVCCCQCLLWLLLSLFIVTVANVRCCRCWIVKMFFFSVTVAGKLVASGFQPHLEDFLLRLDFNHYYANATRQ